VCLSFVVVHPLRSVRLLVWDSKVSRATFQVEFTDRPAQNTW
jgi:hypothetical protein